MSPGINVLVIAASVVLLQLLWNSHSFVIRTRFLAKRSLGTSFASLRMHGSHDHAHDHSTVTEQKSLALQARSFSLFGRLVEMLKVPFFRGAFAAMVMFLPLMLKKKLKSNYSAVALVSAILLAVFDDLKSQSKLWVGKANMFQSSLRKHSSPLTKEYFFKNENAADRVTLLGVWINILLSVVKFAGGIVFKSAVLVADAGHSLSDLFSDFITLWAVQVARIPPDDDHPYGHGKFESIGSLFLSLTLLATGAGVASWSYEKVIAAVTLQRTAGVAAVTAPSWEALALAFISIASKEWLFGITKRVGDVLNSQVVIANAWHHRSDAFSSILALFSIAIAIVNPRYLLVDPLCGIFIAGMIMLTGLEILAESIKQLSDSANKELEAEVEAVTVAVDGVLGVARVRARNVGHGNIVDLAILADGKSSSSSASLLAEKVRWTVMSRCADIIDVTVRTQSSAVVCPLLVSQQRTSGDIEASVRGVLLAEAGVERISRVNVFFLDGNRLGVEAIVTPSPVASSSVQALRETAQRVREALMAQDREIVQADILLAL